jgi:O-antigen ligase
MAYTPIEEIYYWGSGRIGTYIQRIDLLSERAWGPLLIGSGMDSDWLRSYTWVFEEKNSHNLFLSIAIERGIIGLIGLAVFLMAIYHALPSGPAKAFFWVIIVGGLIGHGFVADTLFRLMLFSGMALAIVAAKESRQGP